MKPLSNRESSQARKESQMWQSLPAALFLCFYCDAFVRLGDHPRETSQLLSNYRGLRGSAGSSYTSVEFWPDLWQHPYPPAVHSCPFVIIICYHYHPESSRCHSCLEWLKSKRAHCGSKDLAKFGMKELEDIWDYGTAWDNGGMQLRVLESWKVFWRSSKNSWTYFVIFQSICWNRFWGYALCRHAPPYAGRHSCADDATGLRYCRSGKIWKVWICMYVYVLYIYIYTW